jgi:hypothetical protein
MDSTVRAKASLQMLRVLDLYLTLIAGSNAATLPQSRTGPVWSLPTTGRPVVLGPAGVPLLPGQQPLFSFYQPTMMFDDELDLVGDDIEHDTAV